MDTPERPHPSRRTATPEELLEHAGWVRALSRVLVADPHTAEDVEQEAWVAALKRPPEPGEGLRAWWARVVRNEASDARRARGRREAREIAAPGRAEPPTPLEANTALEAQRKLVAAIDSLAEPLRSTVIRRYVQGMSSPEIAELDEVSESTVRTRLQRALGALRRELDDRTPGGRAAWSAMLAPLATEDAPVAAASAVPLAGFAFSGNAIAVALTIAAVGAFAVLRLVSRSTPEEVASVESAQDASRPHAGAELAQVDGRASRTLPAGPPDTTAVVAAAPATPTARVEVRFVDADGAGIHGVRFTHVSRVETKEIERAEAPQTTSGADGRALLELAFGDVSTRHGQRADRPENVWDLAFQASGSAWRTRAIPASVTFGATVDLGAFTLEPGTIVRGRVTRDSGAPIPGAMVRLVTPDLSLVDREDARRANFWRQGPTAFAKSDPTGVWEIPGAPIGTFRAYATVEGHSQTFSEPFTLLAGVPFEVPDLVCAENPFRIQGRVLLPNGSPAAGCEVSYRMESEGEVAWIGERTRKDGTFLLEGSFGPKVAISAISTKPLTGEVLLEDVAPGTLDLELRLPEPRSVEVVVRDDRGTPLEEFELGVHLAEDGTGSVTRERRPGGTATVQARAIPFHVQVAGPGFETQLLGPYVQATVPPRLDVVLRRVATVRGRLLNSGRPVRGATVNLSGLLEGPEPGRAGFRVDASAPLATATCERDGAFVLPVPPLGTYVAWSVADSGVAESDPFEVRTAEDAIALELDFAQSGRIEGRVLVPKERALDDVVVLLSCGLPEPRIVRAGADGSFVAENVKPGPWLAVAEFARSIPGDLRGVAPYEEHPALERIEVAGSGTTQCTIDLAAVEPREVAGRLRLTGSEARTWVASLIRTPLGESLRRSAEVAADGSFHVPAACAGPHTLLLRAVSGPDREDRIDIDVDMRHGRIAWSLERACGTLDLEGPPLALRECRIDLGASGRWTTRFRLDSEGRARLDGLPAGRARIQDSGNAAVPVDVDVPAGAATRLRVR